MSLSLPSTLNLPDRRRNLLGAFLLLVAIALFAFTFTFEGASLKALGLMIFGLVAGSVLLMPYDWAIQLLFLYLGFEGMAKIITGYNPVIHVGSDALVAALTARWFFSFLLQRTQLPKRYPPLAPLLAVHFIWYLIEFCNPTAIGLIPSLAAAKMYVTMVLLFFYGYYLSSSVDKVEKFTRIWVITLAIQSITSLYQGWLGPVSVLSISGNYADPLQKFGTFAFRPFGTTNIPGAPAIFIFLGAPFLVYHLLRTRSNAIRLALGLVLPAALLTLGLCQVRSALLKMLIGVGVLVFVTLSRASGEVRRRMLIAIPVVAVALALVLPRLTGQWVESREENSRAFERTLSLFEYDKVSGARSGAKERVMSYFLEFPLGAGLSRTGAAGGKFESLINDDPIINYIPFTDNFWAATLAEIGIPGSLILTSFIISVLVLGSRNIQRTRDPQLCSLQGAILGALLAQAVGLWGAEGILYNPEAPFFWFFSGVLMRLPDLDV